MNLLLLALAINFEPTRIGLLPLLLSHEKPRLQLLIFIASNLMTSIGCGLLVLFIFEHASFTINNFSSEWIQTGVGTMALLAAFIIAWRWIYTRRPKDQQPMDSESASRLVRPKQGARFNVWVSHILSKGRSPVVTALVGIGVGLPSVDFLAVLVLIASSGAPPSQQAAALVIFVIAGSLVMLLPLLSILTAPARTLMLIERFSAWLKSRPPIEYAGLLAVVGCLMIGEALWTGHSPVATS